MNFELLTVTTIYGAVNSGHFQAGSRLQLPMCAAGQASWPMPFQADNHVKH